jgi:hypothetical protein
MRKLVLGALAAGFLTIATAAPAQAQVPINAPPVVSYYYPPATYNGVYLPPTVRVKLFYISPQHYYPIPSSTVSYFAPSAAIVAPANAHLGWFGRQVIDTPFYKARF